MVRRRHEVVSEGIYSRRFHKCLQNAEGCFGRPQKLGFKEGNAGSRTLWEAQGSLQGVFSLPSPPRSLLTACFLDFGQLLCSLGAQLCTKTILRVRAFYIVAGQPSGTATMVGVDAVCAYCRTHIDTVARYIPASVTVLRSNI